MIVKGNGVALLVASCFVFCQYLYLPYAFKHETMVSQFAGKVSSSSSNPPARARYSPRLFTHPWREASSNLRRHLTARPLFEAPPRPRGPGAPPAPVFRPGQYPSPPRHSLRRDAQAADAMAPDALDRPTNLLPTLARHGLIQRAKPIGPASGSIFFDRQVCCQFATEKPWRTVF